MTEPYLEIVDAEIAELNALRQKIKDDIANLQENLGLIGNDLLVLQRIRMKQAALNHNSPSPQNGRATVQTGGVTSATKEIRRLLEIRPMTSAELADDIEPRLVTESDKPRRIVLSSIDQLIRKGHVTRDESGVMHLIPRTNNEEEDDPSGI